MAKRFIDTNLFRKRWIRELDIDMKLFWIYLLTDCDHAGIWDVDIERASFQLNLKLTRFLIMKLLFLLQGKMKMLRLKMDIRKIFLITELV